MPIRLIDEKESINDFLVRRRVERFNELNDRMISKISHVKMKFPIHL